MCCYHCCNFNQINHFAFGIISSKEYYLPFYDKDLWSEQVKPPPFSPFTPLYRDNLSENKVASDAIESD